MLEEQEYDFLRDLVRARTGMVLDQSKNYLIDARLEPLSRKEGLADLGELVEELRRKREGALAERVADAMMVHETSFFRDVHPFETLRTRILPELKASRGSERRLAIWCAACSSGQEPYSIAMTLVHHFPELKSWEVRIHVSDISERMLDRTREGRYGRIEVNRGLPATMLSEFFLPDGNDWLVRDDLRKMIHPFRVNLVGVWPALPMMDVVFLRNVLIYFDVREKRSILGRVALQLRPDGALFLGAAETTLQIADQFETRRTESGIYYRPRR